MMLRSDSGEGGWSQGGHRARADTLCRGRILSGPAQGRHSLLAERYGIETTSTRNNPVTRQHSMHF
eukprot:527736-Rhodomonas_salina.1